MEWIKIIFGEGSDLNCLQMSSRAVVTFFIALALIRIAGIRTFGKRSAFDNVIMILLGSVLSRAVYPYCRWLSGFRAGTLGAGMDKSVQRYGRQVGKRRKRIVVCEWNIQ